jgi:hypothetical protein
LAFLSREGNKANLSGFRQLGENMCRSQDAEYAPGKDKSAGTTTKGIFYPVVYR